MQDSLLTLVALCPFLVLLFGIPLVVIVGVIFLFRNAQQRVGLLQQTWTAFGQANGLSLDEGSPLVNPKLTGQYQGRPVTLTLFATRLPRRRTSLPYTRAITPVRIAPDIHLEVSNRSQTGNYYRTPGPDTLNVGDDKFLDKYEVKGNSMALAQSLLTPSIQAEILKSGLSYLEIQKGDLRLDYWGMQTEQEILGAMLELLGRIADAIEQGGNSHG